MKILIASGSFKDVYDPVEACEVIKGALCHEENLVETQPICDGGEYTFDILKKKIGMEEVFAEGILNPYHREVKAHYLVKGQQAHIVSSEILRLYPKEDNYKNPLKLTDYGLGQLVLDAITRGIKDIVLYIGGTSTVACGMGFAQALGAKLYDRQGNILADPVCGEDLEKIGRIETPEKNAEIRFQVVADGDAKSYEMSQITALKIGKAFLEQKEEIIEKTNRGIENVRKISGIAADAAFTGAAGGLRFGIDQIFVTGYVLGGSYFSKLFHLEEKLKAAELVITGEGRLDNTACGKTPAYVAEMAERHHKPVYFVCGQLAPGTVSSYAGGIVRADREKILQEMGIHTLFTCQEFYDKNPQAGDYRDMIRYYKVKTPELLKQLFEKEGL